MILILDNGLNGSHQDEKPYFRTDVGAVRSSSRDDWANHLQTGTCEHMPPASKPTVLEFFAGGGLAQLGLEPMFQTIWANDFDRVKAAAWVENYGADGFVFGDVHDIDARMVPKADLAWASFPCQDLSLAGDRGGLGAQRSSAFYGFTRIIGDLKAAARAPKVLILENVAGLLTSRGGRDFGIVLQVLADLGYRSGALEIDARFFLPQSRPRVFIVAIATDVTMSPDLTAAKPSIFVTPAIAKALHQLPKDLRDAHVNWALPRPPQNQIALTDMFDDDDQNWWPAEKCAALIASFSPRHTKLFEDIARSGKATLGTIYRRTRTKAGIKATFAEARFDGIAGCLRTPGGGSSRQFWILVDGSEARVRPFNPREAMRLMGVSDTYILPKGQLAGLKIAGDGVAVPVVSWLAEKLLVRLILCQ